MSNRFWFKGNLVAMCHLNGKPCPYPYAPCSVCPIDNSSGDHQRAQYWSDVFKPKLEEKRKARLKELDEMK